MSVREQREIMYDNIVCVTIHWVPRIGSARYAAVQFHSLHSPFQNNITNYGIANADKRVLSHTRIYLEYVNAGEDNSTVDEAIKFGKLYGDCRPSLRGCVRNCCAQESS